MEIWLIIAGVIGAALGLTWWRFKRALKKSDEAAIAGNDPEKRRRLQEMADKGIKIN